MSILEQWLAESKDTQREFNQERLIVDVAELITKTLNESSMNQATLARELGKSKGYVSQLLNGSRNMTLRTLADIATELDKKVEFKFIDNSHENWVKINTRIPSQKFKMIIHDSLEKEEAERMTSVTIKHKCNYIATEIKSNDEFTIPKNTYGLYSKETFNFDNGEYINISDSKRHMAIQ